MTRIIKCPHCGAQAVYTDNPNRPFCSERCRLIDLGQWADEEYRIAGKPAGTEQTEFDTGE